MARLHRWPVFICYRRVDGAASARRLHEMLAAWRTTTPDGDEIEIDPYLDETMPGVADWRSLHRPYLEKARALIVVCTPGARIDEGEQDWVHREIDWWIENRDQAPILIDPLMEGSRFVPVQIAERWPDIQRIAVVEAEWARLDGPELTQKVAAVRRQVVGAILPSGAAIYDEELRRERARAEELREARDVERSAKQRARAMFRVAGGLLVAAVGLGGTAAYLGQQSRRNAVIAEASALDAKAAASFEALRILVARRAGVLENRMDLIAQAGGSEPAAPPDAAAASDAQQPSSEAQVDAPPAGPAPAERGEAQSAQSKALSVRRQSLRADSLRTEIARTQKRIEELSREAEEKREAGLRHLADADTRWRGIVERGWLDPREPRTRPALPLVFSVEVLNAGAGEAILVHYGPLDRPRLILINTGPRRDYQRLRDRLAELSLRDYGGRPVPLELIAIGDQDEQKTGGLFKLLEEMAEAGDKGPPPATIETIWANIFHSRGGAADRFRNRIRALAEQLGIAMNHPFGTPLMRPQRGQLVHRLAGGMSIAVLGPGQAQLEALYREKAREAAESGSVIEPFEARPPAPSSGPGLQLRARQAAAAAAGGCVPSRRAKSLAGGGYTDASPHNLASSILLFEFEGHTFLHTGDSRGDLILEGLAAAGLLDSGGRIHVDLMNIPHSGSPNNVTPDFFERVRADSYLFTGNGRFNNPAIEVIAGLIAARGCDTYGMYFTMRDYAERRSRRPGATAETMDEFFAAEQVNNPNYERQVLVERRGSFFTHLKDPLP